MLEILGVKETGLIANLCPLTLYPHGAFTRVLHAACSMNIPVVSAMPGRPSPFFQGGNRQDDVVRIIERNRATILWGVPSYIRRILIRAEELGADFSAVRLVFVTGELCSENLRADLGGRLERLGASRPFISISYGATELQAGIIECSPGNGYHNPAPDQFYIEIVDAKTHSPVEEGEEGLILLTHLKRRGTVLLRYALGDITAKTKEPCPSCGAHTDRILVAPRRADDLIKVKGMLVNPHVIEAVMSGQKGITEYQVVVDKVDPSDPDSMDRLTIRVAVGGEKREALSERIGGEIKEAIGVTPVVEFFRPDQLFDPDKSFKSKRFLDLRRKSGE
jgi:phenylacetate-coenzyme A ligase PaaK-like adenylate-forming protein